MEFIPAEKGVSIRMPSVANLQVDSTDKTTLTNLSTLTNGSVSTLGGYYDANPQSIFNFTINRPNSILNGYFTRISVPEVQMEWDIPNVQGGITNPNNILQVTVSSATVAANLSSLQLTLPSGYYNAGEVVDFTLAKLNGISSVTGIGWNWTSNTSNAPIAPTQSYYLTAVSTNTGANPGPPLQFGFNYTTLAKQMNFITGSSFTAPNYSNVLNPQNPDIRILRYVDFISPSLTYNQNIKDATTNLSVEPSLCRWMFGWGGNSQDSTTSTDKYNFPLYQGYRPFIERRTFPLPKQIKWEPNMPIGQLKFQWYGELFPQDTFLNIPYGALTAQSCKSFNTSYMMNLQISEV
jgi:hypothetical protein